jgi:hypothetical protein
MDASKKFGRHLKEQKGAKHMRPSGTGSFCIATQALRT